MCANQVYLLEDRGRRLSHPACEVDDTCVERGSLKILLDDKLGVEKRGSRLFC